MGERSIDMIGASIRFAKGNIRDICVLAAVWYAPAVLLRVVFDRGGAAYFPEWTTPIINDVVFRLLFSVFAVSIGDHHLLKLSGSAESFAAIPSRTRRSAWMYGLATLVIPILAILPQTILKTLWPEVFTGPYRGPTAVLAVIPLILVQFGLEFSSYLIVPAAMIGKLPPLQAWKRSWKLIRTKLDRTVVTIVLVSLISLVLNIPVIVYAAAYRPGISILIDLLGRIVFSFTAALAVALRMLVATSLYITPVSDSDADEAAT